MFATVPNSDKVRETVREGYARIASGAAAVSATGDSKTDTESACRGGGCCGSSPPDSDALAERIGYSSTELADLPDGSNLGLSCGNPTAIASLCPGEVVLDLGSGAGFDAFVAGPKVGETGRVIGVDMTPEMISKARRNASVYRERSGLHNVEFRLGEIEHLPAADASVDVVISNCVLNLSPDKPRVWKEIARVLRSGGRVAISDLALLRPLPERVASSVAAYVGCVAGAALIEDIRRMAEEAGLIEIEVTPKDAYTSAMNDVRDPLYARIKAELPSGTGLGDYVTSVDIRARKPSP